MLLDKKNKILFDKLEDLRLASLCQQDFVSFDEMKARIMRNENNQKL